MIEVIDHVEIHGIAYKIGVHGLPFYLYQGDWIKSEVPASEIRAAMRREERRAQALPVEEVSFKPLPKKPKKPKKAVKKPRVNQKKLAMDALWASDVSLTRLEWAAKAGIPAGSMAGIVRGLVEKRLALRAAKKPVAGAMRPVQTFRANRHKKRVAA